MAENVGHRSIIMPIDSSDHSLRAFEWYQSNIKQSGDILILVHIVEPQYATSVISISDSFKFKIDDMDSKMDSASKKAKELIEKYTKLAEKEGIHAKGIINVDNKAGDAIVKITLDNKASMIIIGNRGIGTIRRTILGSTSDYILSHANVPVIIVPPPK